MKTITAVTSPFKRAHGGFSIIELLISVAVGLLALGFATRMVGQSEQHKQNTLGGSDSMQNGVLAMFSMSNDLGQAGWGLNDPMLSGCDAVFSDTKNFALTTVNQGAVPTRPLAPVVIEANGLAPDRISVYSGSAIGGTGGLALVTAVVASSTRLEVGGNPYGFAKGDVVAVATDAVGASKCAVAQVANDPTIAVPTGTKPFFTLTAGSDLRFNGSGSGLGQAFPAKGARVFNLGPADKLAFHTWSVADGFLKLRSTNLENASQTPATVVDNIVSIKGQYGFDTRIETPIPTPASFTPENGMVISQWSSSMIDADSDGVIAGPGDYQRVAAVRLAVVARGRAPERPAAGADCSATPAPLVVFSKNTALTVPAVPITIDVAVPGDPVADWKCYRYRVFETIVPIRNNAWRPTAL